MQLGFAHEGSIVADESAGLHLLAFDILDTLLHRYISASQTNFRITTSFPSHSDLQSLRLVFLYRVVHQIPFALQISLAVFPHLILRS
jgi:hypothetical protein